MYRLGWKKTLSKDGDPKKQRIAYVCTRRSHHSRHKTACGEHSLAPIGGPTSEAVRDESNPRTLSTSDALSPHHLLFALQPFRVQPRDGNADVKDACVFGFAWGWSGCAPGGIYCVRDVSPRILLRQTIAR